VPGVTVDDVWDWHTEAMNESGITEGNDNAVLYLAFSIGCQAIATDAARYFKYTDGEENVDKTNVFDNYSKLAREALARYYYYKKGGSSTLTPKRRDNR
jgi:hypothetical protein